MIDQILLIGAAICFAAAALNVKSPIQLGWLGLLLWVASVLL